MLMPTNIRLSVVSVACALFLSGLAIGVGTAYSLYNKKLQEANLTSASLLAFTQNQSTMLVQTGSGKLEKAVSAVSALPATTQAAAPGLPAPTAPALPASSPLPASSSSLFPAAPIPVLVPISPALATQGADVPRSTLESPALAKSALAASASAAPASRTAPASAKAKKHAKPVAAHHSVLAQAPASARAPRASAASAAAATAAQPQVPVLPPITMDQAGIAGIDTAGIRFRSGRQVNIGSDFPTGEKLISVSPSEGRIVTDRRVINLIKPQAAN